MDILSIVCIFFYLGRIWGQEQAYVVLAPKVFYVGASENVVIQVHGYTEPFAVSVAIKSYPDKSFTYSLGQLYLSPENKFQGSASLTIKPKDLPEGPNAVSYVYLEVTCAHFSKTTEIPLHYDNGFIFIQTDKFTYSPDEPVKVRVYALDEDLKPSQREVTLTFIDPEGSETVMVGQSEYVGITTFPDFQMRPYPKYGLWTIKTKFKKDFTTTGTAYFEIKAASDAMRPQFTVLIEPEDYFISHKHFEDFKITIKARYSPNENVSEADVFVFFGIKEKLDDNRKEMMLAGTQTTKLIDGIAKVNFNTSKAISLSNKNIEELNNKYLYIFVEVKKGDSIHENKVADVEYILSPYTLDLVATPLFLKPGIPFSIKVQVKNVIGHLIRGIAVTLKAKVVHKTMKTNLDIRQSKTNSDGVASFVINIPTDVTTLEFHVRTNDPDLPEQYQASNDYKAVAYSSNSESFLSLTWPDSYKNLLVGEHLRVTITPKSPYVEKITHYNYLISSKGKIVYFGAEKKLPGSSSQLLNLPLTQHMAPTACLLVYYFVTGGQTTELVSDSVCLKIQEKCGYQLQIHLSPNKDIHSPDIGVTLTMETQSNLWVALSSVDMASYHFEERSKNPKERILQTSPKRGQDCGTGGGRNNAEVLYSTGLTVLTNVDAGHSQREDGSFTKLLRSKRELQKKIKETASTFKHPVIQKCCYDGAHVQEETCEQRVARIKIGPICSQAFLKCCDIANLWRRHNGHIEKLLGGHHVAARFRALKIEPFSENWLWKVYHVPKRHQVDLILPDFSTTWEIQGVSISDKGLCVTDALQLKVFEDHFLVINNNATETNEEGHFQHPDSRT
ncbi:complement C5-like isoform X2 [Sorex fumeus]|uniref:complement C5-like isoform X2 n=1 Tax=Sorex fumeus TaxID=62283 RepID=UPI0024AD21C3|nr:complement C5-like isoform X2 [Sorex fumeus]